ncbi:Glutathione S-transferase C-terminal-like protein [Dioscorea alata]|uniref:Glutathione S-transferase C-terminal-like protein n=1 Tax=Dioscorea alata TaxID=55571 RepID=A0ACB7TV35_DIOAL|nr:Glutathione S-transferase C-terminal-like protein [Dioscorea alata]
MASSSSNTPNQNPSQIRFQEWIAQQESDLQELISATTSPNRNEAELQALISKILSHFAEYVQKRHEVAKDEATELLCPPWCSSYETSSFWLGGCRPSMATRLLFCVAGIDIEEDSNQVLSGATSPMNGTVTLSPVQLRMIDDLQMKTIKAEDMLSGKMANLQEDMVDKPLFKLVKERGVGSADGGGGGGGGGGGIRNGNNDVEKGMKMHVEAMGEIVKEADKMRLEMMNEVVREILSPEQAVEFLVAVVKMHLTIHQWGGLRDLQRANYRRG